MVDVLTHDSCKNVSCYVFIDSLLIDDRLLSMTVPAADDLPPPSVWEAYVVGSFGRLVGRLWSGSGAGAILGSKGGPAAF